MFQISAIQRLRHVIQQVFRLEPIRFQGGIHTGLMIPVVRQGRMNLSERQVRVRLEQLLSVQAALHVITHEEVDLEARRLEHRRAVFVQDHVFVMRCRWHNMILVHKRVWNPKISHSVLWFILVQGTPSSTQETHSREHRLARTP
jgi:hypothetical protein